MRFLLVGGSGQVGQELRGLKAPPGVEICAPTRQQLDLLDPRQATDVIARGRWSGVINAAAYTDVDRAEAESDMVFSVNARAPAQLAAAAAKQSIPIIHISTDYVFDGQKDVPYVEHDQVAPLNVYGRSKLSGEEGVRAANPQHVVLRTSWIHSPYCKNFVKTILRLAAERDRLAIVADQRGCPTAAVDIAEACLHIAINCAEGPSRAAYGTYHFAGSGEASWFEFASAIVESASDWTGRRPHIQPIPTSEYPTPAKRPANTRLYCSAVKEKFGCDQRPWRRGLQSTIDRLLAKRNLS